MTVDSFSSAENALHPLSALREKVARVRSFQPPRKFYHFLMGSLAIVLYLAFLTREEALAFVLWVGIPMVSLDILRLVIPRLNGFLMTHFGYLMRKEEQENLSGNSFFIFGLLVTAYLYAKPIAILSVLFLTVGDPIAAWMGSRFGAGRYLRRGKSWVGFFANLTVSSLACFCFCRYFFQVELESAFILALVGGLASAIAEILPLPGNDNLTIPVLSGLALTGVCEFLGIAF